MRFILLFLTTVLFSFATQAQIPFVRDIALNETSTPVKVNTLLQDSCGYLWLGTDKGLYRYNGNSFVRIPDPAKQAVTALKLKEGKLWAGFKNGKLGFAEHAHVQLANLKIKAPASPILDITSGTGSNVLWLSTEEGIFMVRGDSAHLLNTDSGLSDNYIYTSCLKRTRGLLAGSDHGINDLEWKYGKLTVKVLTTENGLPDNIVRVIKEIPGKSLYWVGMQQGGIALYDAQKQEIINFRKASHWPYGQVNDILPLSATKAWIATDNGYLLLARLDPGQTLRLSPFYYPGTQFKKLLAGRSGNIWAATGKGLSMITAEFLSYFKLSRPYSLKSVTAMTCDRENNIWLAQDRDLYRLVSKEGQSSLQLIYRAHAVISCLYSDFENRLWIGTMGAGLWYKSQNAFINCQGSAALKNGNILSITGTADRLWVAALTGVDELAYPDGTKCELRLIRHHNKQSGIGSDYIYFLFPDHKGNIWMATDGAGICMFDGTAYHHYKGKPGNKVAYSITEDKQGSIWAAAYYKGLFHFNPQKPGNIIHEEVSDANISVVAANASGQVFAVYERCIDAWYPNSGQFRHFNYRLGIDSTSAVLNCFAKDSSGNLYIPFEDGLLLFKSQSKDFDIRPNVHITKVSALSKDTTANKKQFNYNENYITFSFEGINFTNPERFHYRYRLKGYDKEWIATNDETVTFPNLPPGAYTFLVQVSLDDNFKGAREDQYDFIIKAPLWDKTWFIILLFLIVTLIVYTLVRRKNKKQQQLVQLQRERMNFEYEYLKSQVNPHFLFNSLNTLTNLIEENSGAAVDYTERLSDLYKNMISFRNRDLISLKEEWEILSNYLFIQRSRFGAALQVRSSIPGEIMESKKIIPMALQMLVENAIKHNVVSLAQPLIISIQSNQEEITVRNRLQPKFSKEKGAGLALINIRKRYSLLTSRSVTFEVRGEEYVVTLPLL